MNVFEVEFTQQSEEQLAPLQDHVSAGSIS